MTRVEFRYYQCLLNPTSGDRVTIALVYWDGSLLHCAHSLRVLPPLPDAQRRLLGRALQALEERVTLVNESSKRSGGSLQEVFPVREGLGSLLFWSELQAGLTSAPELHFQELCSLLRFSPRPARPVRLSTRQLAREVEKLGAELAKESPERVKVNTSVGTWHPHISPLSWKNGAWHHTVPFSFAGLQGEAQIREAAETIIGRVRAMVPAGEVPVVVAALPDDPELAALCRHEANVVREVLKEQKVVVLAEPAKNRAYLHRLEQEARHDIAAE